jgi:imidazolonepropionase-like amidohydrolase
MPFNYRILIVVSAILALQACDSSPRVGTSITNVTIIDAKNGVRENHTVVMDGDEIVAVTPADQAAEAAVTIDGSGKYLIPGLWDMHVHLTYDDRFTDLMPQLFLAYGITSVRDTGGLMHKLLPVVERMRAPDALAPRVYFSGPLLDGEYVVYDGKSQPEIGISNASPEMADANVAYLKKQGVDFIKIYELVSPEVFATLVAAASRHELPIAAHVPLSTIASESGPLVGSMEHLRNIEMDCAENATQLHETRLRALDSYEAGSGAALRRSLHNLQRLDAIESTDEARCDEVLARLASTIQVPTSRLNGLPLISPLDRSDWQQAVAGLPDSIPESWQALPSWIASDPEQRDTRYAEWSLNMIGRMNAAGLSIGAGTDTPLGVAIPGYSLHNELDILVRAGLTPLEALRSATVTPAEFLSLDDEMGTIDVGKRADVVLLTADPLVDIHNTRMIELVISKGTVVPRPDRQR